MPVMAIAGGERMDAANRLSMVTGSMLFPTTDAAVMAQAVAVVLLTIAAVWRFRRNKDVLLFVIGLFMVTAAFFGVRALH
jgi:F0F1-type ATP synthase beta subunit